MGVRLEGVGRVAVEAMEVEMAGAVGAVVVDEYFGPMMD